MIYIVTDRENKDRQDFIVDTFETREQAEQFVADSGEYYQVEEWDSVEDARGE